MCSGIAGIKYFQRAVGRVENRFAHSKRPISISWSSTPNSSKSVAVCALLGERARQADADSLRATAIDIHSVTPLATSAQVSDGVSLWYSLVPLSHLPVEQSLLAPQSYAVVDDALAAQRRHSPRRSPRTWRP